MWFAGIISFIAMWRANGPTRKQEPKGEYNVSQEISSRVITKKRKQLQALSSRGNVSARKLNRARVLLLGDGNRPKGPMADAMIRQILDVSLSAIARIRRQFSIDGLSAALDEKPRPGRPIKFGGDQRAEVTAFACTTSPEENSQWSLRLIAHRGVLSLLS